MSTTAAAGSRFRATRTPAQRAAAKAARHYRNVELALLIGAAFIVGAAATIVDLNSESHITLGLLYALGGFAVVWFIAHLAVRRWARYADPIYLPITALLNGIGVVFIHRLDLAYVDRAKQLGESIPGPAARQQIIWMLLGLVCFVIVLIMIKDHRVLARYSYLLGLAGLALLAIPAVLPASLSQVNGARIWIRLGGMSVQPGEFAKLLLMVFFASYFVTKRDVLSIANRRFLGLPLPRARDLGPVLLAWGASLLVLVRESDLGTSLLFFGIFIVMLYVTTERISWLIIGLILFCGGAFAAYETFAHVRERITIWLHPFQYASGNGYQIVQARFGLGTGGLFGTGLGLGQPQMVPFANSDFITSTIGEELGMFGLVAVLALYAIIVMRGFRAGIAIRDEFGKLFATGLAFGMGFQVFIIVGGVTKLIPLTGLTTPFLSQGGSSLVANYVLIALLLRITHTARDPQRVLPPDPNDERPAWAAADSGAAR